MEFGEILAPENKITSRYLDVEEEPDESGKPHPRAGELSGNNPLKPFQDKPTSHTDRLTIAFAASHPAITHLITRNPAASRTVYETSFTGCFIAITNMVVLIT